MQTKILIGVVLLVIVGVAGFFAWKMLGKTEEVPVSTAMFSCDEGKTINASFYSDRADITLSDGRKFSLSQLDSASGARYGTKDENFIFWNKGDTAFVMEGKGGAETYSNCEIAKPGEESRSTYTSQDPAFTIQYPKGYVVNSSYAYDQFGEDKLINGVKFTIPATMATGTNLSSDTGISVEWLPRAKSCTGDIYLLANVKASKITENGIEYSMASSSDAGAGNRYEETVYAIASSTPCIAIRYFIHYSALENYPTSTVREFDRAALIAAFDKIRQSLTLK
ncbi:MliC family protein [Acetobacteraceae bacterium]|nr:MliC family protein [Candidatus Parcubacteria bacterium]